MFKKLIPESETGEVSSRKATRLPSSIIRNQEPTPIGPSMHFSGHIRGNDDLIVHGHVEGTVDLGDGLLMVTRDGKVDADVSARVITIEGQASGKLQATEQIIVRRSGRVRGSISAPRIALDFGCAFSGSIDTDTAEDATPATRDDKIADFKSAISSSSGVPARSTMGKSSQR
jgi:cytoskeletal protein CcmA (bactofilin family)